MVTTADGKDPQLRSTQTIPRSLQLGHIVMGRKGHSQVPWLPRQAMPAVSVVLLGDETVGMTALALLQAEEIFAAA